MLRTHVNYSVQIPHRIPSASHRLLFEKCMIWPAGRTLGSAALPASVCHSLQPTRIVSSKPSFEKQRLLNEKCYQVPAAENDSAPVTHFVHVWPGALQAMATAREDCIMAKLGCGVLKNRQLLMGSLRLVMLVAGIFFIASRVTTVP